MIYAIVCCVDGTPGLLETGKKGSVIKTKSKKIPGNIDKVSVTNKRQVIFKFVTTNGTLLIFQVVKMTTLSPIKNSGTQQHHLKLIERL